MVETRTDEQRAKEIDETLAKLVATTEKLLADREKLVKRSDAEWAREPARAPRGSGPISKTPGSGTLSIADSVALLEWHASRGVPLDRATWKKIGFDRQ